MCIRADCCNDPTSLSTYLILVSNTQRIVLGGHSSSIQYSANSSIPKTCCTESPAVRGGSTTTIPTWHEQLAKPCRQPDLQDDQQTFYKKSFQHCTSQTSMLPCVLILSNQPSENVTVSNTTLLKLLQIYPICLLIEARSELNCT